MKMSHVSLLVVAAVLVGATLLTNSYAQVRGGGSVAICDIEQLFKNYQKAIDRTKEMNKQQEAIGAEVTRRQQEIKEIEEELKGGLTPDSDQYVKRLKEKLSKQFELEAWVKYQQAAALVEHRRITRELHAEIIKMVGAVAQARGYQVVLIREPTELTAENTSEMIAQIRNQKVLYYDPGIDITAETLVRLNQAYRAK